MTDFGGQLAVIAGSGFRALGVANSERQMLTEFGAPSAPVQEIELGGHTAYFLARHGTDLAIPAHCVNYRANLKALQLLGVKRVFALNTVGVITSGLHPGELAVPHQLIDYTSGREHTIHVGTAAKLEHIEFTSPFSAAIREAFLSAARDVNVDCHDGGVYAVTQGPRLETAAEIERLERDGADYVGMTAMPEASIACELGMQYACLSLIVNYAAGRSDTAIHDELDDSTAIATTRALKVLQRLFDALS